MNRDRSPSAACIHPRSVTADESGVVLLLTAMLLVVVVIFLAFEIDLGRVGIAQVEQKRAASLGALVGMSSYWTTAFEDEDSAIRRRHDAALKAAVARIEEVINLHDNKALFVPHGTEALEVLAEQRIVPTSGEPVTAQLRYGRWYYHEPAQGCRRINPGWDKSCPCPDKKWNGPCFERIVPTRKDEFATAIQFELATPKDQPVRYLFASVFGQTGVAIRARATVSLLDDTGILSTPRVVENILIPDPLLEEPEPVPAELEDPEDPLAQLPQEPAKVEPTPEPEDDRCAYGSRTWKIAGQYRFSAPRECTLLTVRAWGAGAAAGGRQGGSNHGDGGGGGFASGKIRVQPGEELRFLVGSAGKNPCNPGYRGPADFGGAGASDSSIGSGGGYSAVFRNAAPLLVAAGGGAGGYVANDLCRGTMSGGAGGGLEGFPGGSGTCAKQPASGGTQLAGGAGQNGLIALNGEKLKGGLAGGGGGWFGGGGARATIGGAGGGSSYFADTVIESTTEAGEGREAAGQHISSYQEPAGRGGKGGPGCSSRSAHGEPGLIVVSWGTPRKAK